MRAWLMTGIVAGLGAVSLLFGVLGSNWTAVIWLGAIGLAATALVWFGFPETSGRSLEDIAPEREDT